MEVARRGGAAIADRPAGLCSRSFRPRRRAGCTGPSARSCTIASKVGDAANERSSGRAVSGGTRSGFANICTSSPARPAPRRVRKASDGRARRPTLKLARKGRPQEALGEPVDETDLALLLFRPHWRLPERRGAPRRAAACRRSFSRRKAIATTLIVVLMSRWWLVVLDLPSRKAARNCIASLDEPEVAVASHGVDGAMKRLAPGGTELRGAACDQRVEIDEWKIDLMSIMANSGLLALFADAERWPSGSTTAPRAGGSLRRSTAERRSCPA